MADEDQTVIGKRSKMTVGLVMGLVGTVSWATAIKVQGDSTAKRVDEIQASREIRIYEQAKVNTKILKWLSAIGQKLHVPEPPAN